MHSIKLIGISFALLTVFSTNPKALGFKDILMDGVKDTYAALKDKGQDYLDKHQEKSNLGASDFGVNPEQSASGVLTRAVQNRTFDLDYGFYQVNYHCGHRGFNYVTYNSVPDQGSLPRYSPFSLDNSLPSWCPSQKTTRSYKQMPGQAAYHRGHGNHQNIWDHDLSFMKKTNFMTNIVPQNGVQNSRGLWRSLETRVECARDKTTVTVYLGNDWGNDGSNDYFVESHGVTTPDYLWRVHVYSSHPNQAFVWYMANDEKATSKDGRSSRISLAELKSRTQDDFDWPMPSSWRDASFSDPYENLRCSLK